MRLADKNIITAALNVYASNLRGQENPDEIITETLERVNELRKKQVTESGDFVIIDLTEERDV